MEVIDDVLCVGELAPIGVVSIDIFVISLPLDLISETFIKSLSVGDFLYYSLSIFVNNY